jgi:hypothetical protein
MYELLQIVACVKFQSLYHCFKQNPFAFPFLIIYKILFISTFHISWHFDISSSCDIYFKFDTNRHLSTSLYDKRDDFDFRIINLPHLNCYHVWSFYFTTRTLFTSLKFVFRCLQKHKCLISSFKTFFWWYQYLEMYSVTYIDIVLTNIFWFKVEYCFPIISYNGFVTLHFVQQSWWPCYM